MERYASLLIYGEAGAGKTTLALQVAKNAIRGGAQVLYVTDQGFFFERACEILGQKIEKLYVLEVQSFEDFLSFVDSADNLISQLRVKLIVVDTISKLYQLTTTQALHENVVRSRLLSRHLAKLKVAVNLLDAELLGLSGVVLNNLPATRRAAFPNFDVVFEMRRARDGVTITIVKPPAKIQVKASLTDSGVGELRTP